MDTGCPYCNGLVHFVEKCPKCGNLLEDLGASANYDDPYGPFEETNIGEAALEKGYTGDACCVHLLHCPNCGLRANRLVSFKDHLTGQNFNQ